MASSSVADLPEGQSAASGEGVMGASTTITTANSNTTLVTAYDDTITAEAESEIPDDAAEDNEEDDDGEEEEDDEEMTEEMIELLRREAEEARLELERARLEVEEAGGQILAEDPDRNEEVGAETLDIGESAPKAEASNEEKAGDAASVDPGASSDAAQENAHQQDAEAKEELVLEHATQAVIAAELEDLVVRAIAREEAESEATEVLEMCLAPVLEQEKRDVAAAEVKNTLVCFPLENLHFPST